MNGPEPWLQTHWDWRAAGNFIGGGSGSGLLLVCALAGLSGPPPIGLVALGLGLVLGGLALVWMELGRPWRFLHVFFHPRTSWMTREAGVAMPLVLAGAATLLWGRLELLWLTALLALAFLYCQARILRAARGIPVWRHPRVVPLIISTGLVEGLGWFALLAVGVFDVFAWPVNPLWSLGFLALLTARAVTWHGYRRALQGEAPLAALQALARLSGPFLWLGHALPAALALAAVAADPAVARWLVAPAGALAAALGWVLKFVLIRRAAYNQGYAIEHTAARGGGRPGPGCKPGWS